MSRKLEQTGARTVFINEDGRGTSSNNVGNTSTGRGSRAAAQGLVTIKGYYDKTAIDAFNKSATNRRSLYPKPERTEAYDALDGEIAFQHKMPRSDVSEDKYSVHFCTSLNSVGADAVENFPEDEEMQIEVVKNNIKYVGITRDTITYDSKNKRQGQALQIAGVSTIHAAFDTPTTCLGEIVLPLPSRLNNAERKRRPHTPPNKVVLEMRPYSPRTIEYKVFCHLRNYIDNPDKYKRAMGTKHRSTFAWIDFIECLINSSFVSWALMTSHLQSIGVMNPISLGASPALASIHSGPPPSGDDLILLISKGLGLLPSTDKTGSDINPSIHIKTEHTYFFNCLRRELAKKIHFDGRIVNLEFGYDRTKKKNMGKDEKTKKPILSIPKGRMLYQQLSHTQSLVGGLSDAINRDREWVQHKIIKGGVEGRQIDILP